MAVYFIGFAASTVLSSLLTRCVRDFANHAGLTGGPKSGRDIHTRPIPRLGGVAIFLSFSLLLLLCFTITGGRFFSSPAHSALLKLLPPAAIIFLTGLYDDLRGLGAKSKLLIQVLSGFTLFASGLRVDPFQWAGMPAHTGWIVSLFVTVFWVVSICNAINLIDGLDGLAAGAAIAAIVTIFTASMIEGGQELALAMAVLAGSLCGFLVFNFNPATIFLGDSGSLFVGFMLGGSVLAQSHTRHKPVASIVMLLIAFALPLAELSLSVLRRFLSGRSLLGADREHIHHKLLDLGLTHRQVIWVLYGFLSACVVLSLFVLHPSGLLLVATSAIFLLLFFFGLRKLGYHEIEEIRGVWKRVALQKQAIASNILLRKTATRLQKANSVHAIVEILEVCLKAGFAGFEITLAPRLSISGRSPGAFAAELQRFWVRRTPEDIVLAFHLSTPERRIGQVSLYHRAGLPLLFDPDLIQVELRRGLILAFGNLLASGVDHDILSRDEAKSATGEVTATSEVAARAF